jgi:hypothetical protein
MDNSKKAEVETVSSPRVMSEDLDLDFIRSAMSDDFYKPIKTAWDSTGHVIYSAKKKSWKERYCCCIFPLSKWN